jgi:hypothetical protein
MRSCRFSLRGWRISPRHECLAKVRRLPKEASAGTASRARNRSKTFVFGKRPVKGAQLPGQCIRDSVFASHSSALETGVLVFIGRAIE